MGRLIRTTWLIGLALGLLIMAGNVKSVDAAAGGINCAFPNGGGVHVTKGPTTCADIIATLTYTERGTVEQCNSGDPSFKCFHRMSADGVDELFFGASCIQVTAPSGLMIPLRSGAEWTSFLNSEINNVSFSDCPPCNNDGTKIGTEECDNGALNTNDPACGAGIYCTTACTLATARLCPTCTDLIQNQTETGVDCGGSCPACANCDTPVTTWAGYTYTTVMPVQAVPTILDWSWRYYWTRNTPPVIDGSSDCGGDFCLGGYGGNTANSSGGITGRQNADAICIRAGQIGSSSWTISTSFSSSAFWGRKNASPAGTPFDNCSGCNPINVVTCYGGSAPPAGPYCGNGQCNPGENCVNCPQDCISGAVGQTCNTTVPCGWGCPSGQFLSSCVYSDGSEQNCCVI